MIRDFTALLGKEEGTMALLPVQAVSLAESLLCDGLLSGVGVGHGKTLASLLIPRVMEAERPLLIVPNNCLPQTRYDAKHVYGKHFNLPKNLKLISYHMLSQAKNSKMLEEYKPDVIIADEAHNLKAFSAARTKKFIRYMLENPEVKFFAMSGTLTKSSLHDYWHLSGLALGEGSPIPHSKYELDMWAQALDAGVPDYSRPSPGALLRLCGPEDCGTELQKARSAFQRRLSDTPGVVMTETSSVDIPIKIRAIQVPLHEEMQPYMDQLHNEWVTPSGEELTESFQIWDIDRQLAQGFYYKWKYPAPEAWLKARKKWNSYVQRQLNRNIAGLDSPKQVKNVSAHTKELQEWEAIQHTYRIINEPVYVNDFLIDAAVGWLKEHGQIAWVVHTAVGQRIAEKAGVPYFGGGDVASYEILAHRGPCVASIAAHGTGKNLQRYDRALVVMPPPGGAVWEQLLGRLHRQGQLSDEVIFDFFFTTPRAIDYIRQAHDKATYMEETTKQVQKIRHAEHIGFSI